MRRTLSLFGILALTGLAVLPSLPSAAQTAAAPSLINFQGRLTRPDGTPVANGSYAIRFSLWSAATGGTEKWNQTINPVAVRNGTFAVALNVTTPVTLFDNNNWLEIKIGNDAPLAPRQQLVSVPYAMKANTVPDNSITTAKIADGSITFEKLAQASVRPTGPAGGDLAGTYPNPLLATLSGSLFKVSGTLMSATLASDNLDVVQAAAPFQLPDTAWQSFTAGHTGNLSGIDLIVGTTTGLPKTMPILIYTGEGTGGTLLGSYTTVFATTYGFQRVSISPPIPVVAGQKYTWATAAVSSSLTFGYATGNPYAGGRAGAGDTMDHAFKTYVTVPVGSNVTVNAAFNVSGNATLNGMTQLSGLKIPAGAAAGRILISDASGVATWGLVDASGLAPGATNAWLLGGNNGITSGFLGTLDTNPLELRVNNRRVMRYSDPSNANNRAVNILGGLDINTISTGVIGATISGGGHFDIAGNVGYPNRAFGNFSTIGGGANNTTAGLRATIAGGFNNGASGQSAFIGGGFQNAANGDYSTLAGGFANTANGGTSVISGGEGNVTNDFYTTVAGGWHNTANGRNAVVSGGESNTASGYSSSVAGGRENTAAGLTAFAAGRRAKANHNGAFVWGDSTDADFVSTAADQFLIRAGGGFGINANSLRGNFDLRSPAGNANLYIQAGGAASGVNMGVDSSANFYIANYNGATYQDRLILRSTGPEIRGGTIPTSFFVLPGTLNGTNTANAVTLDIPGNGTLGIWDNVNVSGSLTANSQELRLGTPYLDFSADNSVDYHARIWLPATNILETLAPYITSKGIVGASGSHNGYNNVRFTSWADGKDWAIYSEGQAGGSSGWVNNSDARLKTNVKTLDNALETLLNLRGVNFDWKRDEFKDKGYPGGRQIGFIAQEVQKYLPELVRKSPDGFLGVSYSDFAPLLVEAIKTLNARVVSQQQQNEAKDAKIAELEARLERIEAALHEKQK